MNGMIQVPVFQGTVDMFNAIAYVPEQHPGTLQYIESQFAACQSKLLDSSKNLLIQAQSLYDHYLHNPAKAAAEAALRKVSNFFRRDMVYGYSTLEELQQAGSVMQRWIMACPEVRTLYHQQRCDGYAGSYHDVFPNVVGDWHLDYQMVMNGIVTDNSTADMPEEEQEWVSTTYCLDFGSDDRELTLSEQMDVLSTWDAVRHYLNKNQQDPTSPVGGFL